LVRVTEASGANSQVGSVSTKGVGGLKRGGRRFGAFLRGYALGEGAFGVRDEGFFRIGNGIRVGGGNPRDGEGGTARVVIL